MQVCNERPSSTRSMRWSMETYYNKLYCTKPRKMCSEIVTETLSKKSLHIPIIFVMLSYYIFYTFSSFRKKSVQQYILFLKDTILEITYVFNKESSATSLLAHL